MLQYFYTAAAYDGYKKICYHNIDENLKPLHKSIFLFFFI